MNRRPRVVFQTSMIFVYASTMYIEAYSSGLLCAKQCGCRQFHAGLAGAAAVVDDLLSSAFENSLPSEKLSPAIVYNRCGLKSCNG